MFCMLATVLMALATTEASTVKFRSAGGWFSNWDPLQQQITRHVFGKASFRCLPVDLVECARCDCDVPHYATQKCHWSQLPVPGTDKVVVSRPVENGSPMILVEKYADHGVATLLQCFPHLWWDGKHTARCPRANVVKSSDCPARCCNMTKYDDNVPQPDVVEHCRNDLRCVPKEARFYRNPDRGSTTLRVDGDAGEMCATETADHRMVAKPCDGSVAQKWTVIGPSGVVV